MAIVKTVKWSGGKQADFWSKNAASIIKFVKDQGLKPATIEEVAAKGASAKTQATIQPRTVSARKLPNGGWPLAHLHVGENFYILNEKQWKSFSEGLMGDFQKKLAGAKNIGLEHLVNLSAAVDTISKK